jgi:hypothetical protein
MEDNMSETNLEKHMARLHKPDGCCFHCGAPANQNFPVGPIVIRLSEPDSGDEVSYEFCEWRCFAHWAAAQGGGKFTETQEKVMEIPDDVVVAIKAIAEWGRGGDEPDDVGIDDIIARAVPVLDEWCVARGLLPAVTG